MKRVSKRTVDAMHGPAGGGRSWLWDDQVRGFGVTMTAAGRTSYIEARNRAIEFLRLVEAGVDPANIEADEARAEAASADEREHFAFGNFADRFIKRHGVDGGLRSRADIEGTFERDLRPWFGDKMDR